MIYVAFVFFLFFLAEGLSAGVRVFVADFLPGGIEERFFFVDDAGRFADRFFTSGTSSEPKLGVR
jgi:hypothetical protein